MERRLYFVAGDLLSVVSVACAASFAASLLAPGQGPVWMPQGPVWMPLTMLAGMVTGMVVASLLSFLWIPLFGDFEVMLPTTLAGMVAGMFMGMIAPMWHPEAVASLAVGALVGLACWLWVYWVDSQAARKHPNAVSDGD